MGKARATTSAIQWAQANGFMQDVAEAPQQAPITAAPKPTPEKRSVLEMYQSVGFNRVEDFQYFSIKPSDCCGMHTIHGLEAPFARGKNPPMEDILRSVFFTYAKQEAVRQKMMNENTREYYARQDSKHPYHELRYDYYPLHRYETIQLMVQKPAGTIVFTVTDKAEGRYLQKMQEFGKFIIDGKHGNFEIVGGGINANTLNKIHVGVFTFDAVKACQVQASFYKEVADVVFGK